MYNTTFTTCEISSFTLYVIINILTFPSKFNSHLSKGEDALHRRPEVADRASGAC